MRFFMVPLTKILPPQPLTSKQKVYFYSFRSLAYWPLLFIQFHVFPAATPCGKLQVWLLRATEPPPLCALQALAEALLTKQVSVSRMYALTLMISCAICLVLLISRDILGSLTNEWSVLPLQKLQKRGTVLKNAFKTLEANKHQHWMLSWFSYVDRIPLLLELLGNAISKNFKGPIDSQL